ncbi:hypothetical protein [Deinococcus hohokamensis]|uniref:Uncharacterized protein n=1 Tax=Deinococcus hohokamensis TaxID=309883 RepID=A0ABV9IC26_9DEIO
MTPPAAPDDAPTPPYPLDELRAQVPRTSPAEVLAAINALSERYQAALTPEGWSAAAEGTLRSVIGMERKMGMEMRIGLGERAGSVPLRRTAPLASLNLPQLLEEARATRQTTLALLALVQAAAPGTLRVWTLGEEVEPALYLLALRPRLERLGLAVQGARLNA